MTTEVWQYIAQHLLLPRDRISADEGPNDATVEDFLRRRGRYQDDRHLHVFRPTLTRLTSTDIVTICEWREELFRFLASAAAYQAHIEPGYVVNLREWINADVWRTISQELLYSGDRTKPNQTPNHGAVEDILCCRGRYRDQAEYVVSSSESETEREVTATRITHGPLNPLIPVHVPYDLSHEQSTRPTAPMEDELEVGMNASVVDLVHRAEFETDESDDEEDSSMPPLVSASDDDDERDDNDDDTDTSDAASDGYGTGGTIRLY